MKVFQKMILCLICLVSSLQLFGFIFDSKIIKGIGMSSMIAPFPKVFSDVDGLEPFASKFIITFYHDNGKITEQEITPEMYSKLSGPYNRRNIYGAGLSYAPRLPDSLWKPVFKYGFSGPLSKELDFPTDIKCIEVKIITKTKGRNDIWIIGEKPCH